MAYTKQTWENLPSQTTPINADRLTHIEDGIFNAAATADTAASDASSAIGGLADKVDKVEGKGLSTNDFTDALKTKLDGIASGAEVNVQADYAQTNTEADDYIKNKPTLGTSAYKNSTSVVTDSSDLVESGAVCRAIGIDFKNLVYTKLKGYNVNYSGLVQSGSTYSLAVAKVEANKEYTVSPRASFTDTNFVFAFFANEIVDRSVSYNNSRTVISSEDNSCTFTAPIDGYVGIRIDTVDSTIQLEKGSTATTYEPYHASVEDTLRDAEVVEGKNLLPNKATTTTLNGVTFTVNDDKSITINTVNTGATATTQLTLDSTFEITDDREYIYSGATSGSASKYYLQVYYRDNNNVYKGAKNLYTEPLNIKLSDFSGATKMNTFILVVPSGAVITTPVTVYPMLRLASETDPTYEPYYIPLKDVVPTKADNSVIAPVENGTTASQAYAVNDVFIRNRALCKVTSAISQGDTLSNQFTVTNVGAILTALLNA